MALWDESYISTGIPSIANIKQYCSVKIRVGETPPSRRKPLTQQRLMR